jgi:hypothetical protein
MAAVNWTGNATGIKQVATITIGGTWVQGDTVTVGNSTTGKSIVVTIGATVTVAGVCTAIAQAFNSTTPMTDTTASYQPVTGGKGIPEMALATAVAGTTTVVITGVTAGRPLGTFTIAKTSTAGTASIAATTAATGPNHWDNTANWSTATVPVAADDVTVDRPVSILYGLGQSAVTLASLTVTPRFSSSAQIGLPFRNAGGFEEFLATELAISATTVTIDTQSRLIKLNLGSVQSTITVYRTGSSSETGRNALQIRGTHASNSIQIIGSTPNATAADVGIATNGELATFATVRQDTGTLTIGQAGGGTVTLTTVTKNGGTLGLYAAATTITNYAGDLYHYSGAVTTASHYAGTWYDLTTATYGTLTTEAVYNASGVGSKTITSTTVSAGGSIVDTSDRVTYTNPITWRGTLTVT